MRLIESEITSLKHMMLDMAELVQRQFDQLAEAMTEHDEHLFHRIRRKETEIDLFDNKVERRCARILALYQPVANDLRFVFTVMKINASLEQIGDNINYIARKTLQFPQPMTDAFVQSLRLQEMLSQTGHMLTTALTAFFSEDTQLARRVFPMDDLVDEIHHQDIALITERMQAQPKDAPSLVQLLFVVKNIEKIADYAVSIAEEAIYFTEAEVYRHTNLKRAHRSRDESTDEGPEFPAASSGSVLEDPDTAG